MGLAGVNDSRREAPAGDSGSMPAPAPASWWPAEGPSSASRIEHLGRLLESGPQPFAMIDLQRRLIEVNEAFCRLVGYQREELLGLPISELTAAGSQVLTRQEQDRILASGKVERLVKEYRRKDGSLVPVELVIDVARDAAGNARGLYAFISDISERIRAERAVRVSERRYRELYDDAPVGYLEIDREGQIECINRTACELLGDEPGGIVGRPLIDFMAAEEREAARRAIEEKLSGARVLRPYRQVLVTRDGRRLPIELRERIHRDDEGRIVGIRCVLRDLSPTEKTEAALVEAERRARALFDGIHDAVFVHDLQGRILDANPAACRQLGYTREELIGMTTEQIDDPEFATGFQQRLEQQLRQGRLNCEGLHRTKDGRVIPVEITTSTIQYDQQVAVLAILRDITERRALEETRKELAQAQDRSARELELKNQALSESEARYRQLTEASLDAIVVADAEGRITLFNPAAESAFGYSSGEVLGRPLRDLFVNLDTAAPGSDLDADSSTPSPAAEPHKGLVWDRLVGRTVELSGRRSDGTEFPLEMSLSAVRTEDRIEYLGSIRDQTERQQMRAMLAHTDRLASIGLLSAGVAHEINNPLAYVQNNLAVLQRDLNGLLELLEVYESTRDLVAASNPALQARIDAVAEEIDWSYIREHLQPILERTREGVKRVANIVGKMRGLARTSLPQWEKVSFTELVESTLEMMRGRLRHLNVEVAVRQEDVELVECVPDQLSQVLLNLLINSLQAIEASGRQEGGRIEVAARLSGPWVEISVTDNGCGIDPASIDHVFDPFYTTKPVGEGTGLGLAISHGIVTGHGGRLEVSSRPGEGTTFRILLPRRPAPDQGRRPPLASAPRLS